MPADTLTLRQLNRATLARQLLLAREGLSVADAVGRLAGLQAQEPKPPFLGLWTRLDAFRRDDLSRALRDRSLIRAALVRGTLHIATAEDYAALRPTLQPALADGMRALGDRAEGLDLDAVLAAARALLAERPRTFDELRASLLGRSPRVNDRALGFAVRMHLPLAMVPTTDRWTFPRNADFALADAWLGRPLAGPSPEALVCSYLAAWGPATPADAGAWSGLKGLKSVAETMRTELRTFRDERGRDLFDLPDAPRPSGDVPAPPRFLPEFDNLVLAHADRTRVLADEYRSAVVTKNLRVKATFLLDGVVRGTWGVKRTRRAATLSLAPFAPLPADALTALAEEGEALLHFFEEDAETFDVEVGEVTR
jgi:hypothetical protein